MVDRGGHETPGHIVQTFIYIIYYTFYVTYHPCEYAYTYTYSPLSPSSWLRARRIKWCARPCACIELNGVSPRVQFYIVSLYDCVIKTVSLFVGVAANIQISLVPWINQLLLTKGMRQLCRSAVDIRHGTQVEWTGEHDRKRESERGVQRIIGPLPAKRVEGSRVLI